MQRKLLFIDDDAATRIQIAAVLQKHGWQVDLATNAEEGLAAALPDDGQPCPYPIIITDLSMPDFSGADLIRALRDNNNQLLPKVVVLSGDMHEADLDTFRFSKPDVVLKKPFDPDTCVGMIEELYQKATAP